MPHRFTYAEYAALEMVSEEKREYLDGYIYAMPLASVDHSVLAASMIRVLGNAADDQPCNVHGSGLRIYVTSAGLATFPDASVICGPLQQHEASPDATALNPVVLVEVTSDSSEDYDTGLKFEYYQTIPSLREYVIVSHRERRVTVHVRDAGAWTTRIAGRGERVVIPSIGVDLAVDDIYRKTAIA